MNNISSQEHALVLAALRYWQRMSPDYHAPEMDIATDCGKYPRPKSESINNLIHHIQFGAAQSAADLNDDDRQDCSECRASVGLKHASIVNTDHRDFCSLHPSA